MIVPEEELSSHILSELNSLEGKVIRSTLSKLRAYSRYTTREFYLPVLDYLFLAHQIGNRSMGELAKEVGISRVTLSNIFDVLRLPRLTHEEAVKREVELGIGVHGVNIETGENYRDIGRKKIVELRLGALALTTEEHQKHGRYGWNKATQNPDFKSAGKRARLNPKVIGRYHISSINGYRSDIGFNAQSTWEANFARILIYCGRKFSVREKFALKVPEEYMHLFKSDETILSVDFAAKDPKGNSVFYEIMAHPLEGREGSAKLEMLLQQYPGINLRVIDRRFYDRVKVHFEERIKSAPYLHGWETPEDNLRTNPGKYLSPIIPAPI